MQIISLSIALMTAFVPLINRVLYYGMAYELLYLPNMLKLINNRREKMLVKVFLILMYGGIGNNKIEKIDGFTLYPTEYFCPKNYYTNEMRMTRNTCSICIDWNADSRGRTV